MRTLKDLEQIAEEHLKKELGSMWTDDYSARDKQKMIFGFCQGFLEGEIRQLRKSVLLP